jgi:hypothetical protein
LKKALREASPEVQRRVFKAFEVQILYDKAERRIEISAAVSETVAAASSRGAFPGGLSGTATSRQPLESAPV